MIDLTENPKARKCREMAEKANDPGKRAHWLQMAQFWLKQVEERKSETLEV